MWLLGWTALAGTPTRYFLPSTAGGFDGPPLPVLESLLAQERIRPVVREADGTDLPLPELSAEFLVLAMGLLAGTLDRDPVEQRLYVDGRVFQVIAGRGVFTITRHPPAPLVVPQPGGTLPEEAGRMEGFDDPSEIARVLWARSTLTSEELGLIGPVVFARDPSLHDRGSAAWAGLLDVPPFATVRFYDLGIRWVPEGFAPSVVGPFDAPRPATDRNLVHELGHLVALAGTLASVRGLDALDRRERRRTRRCLQRLGEEILLPAPGFASLPRAGDLTEYGASMTEAFADAFALYKLERSTLSALSPEIVAWFDAGEHLKIRAPCSP